MAAGAGRAQPGPGGTQGVAASAELTSPVEV